MDGITLTQEFYLDKLRQESFSGLSCSGQDKTELLDELGQTLFHNSVGSIGWVSQVTRHDKSRHGYC